MRFYCGSEINSSIIPPHTDEKDVATPGMTAGMAKEHGTFGNFEVCSILTQNGVWIIFLYL